MCRKLHFEITVCNVLIGNGGGPEEPSCDGETPEAAAEEYYPLAE